MPDLNRETHWIRSRKLMWIMLVLWLVFSFGVQLAALPLNRIVVPYLSLPLGFFAAAQGSLLAFALMLFWFARRQDRIDRDHGYDDER
jgi:putative solute:sodium symporter small subunit